MNRLALALSMLALVAFAFAQPVSASLTSVVTDPVGDAVLTAAGIAAPPYQDIVKASITFKDSRFIFLMDLAAPVPNNPPLLPPGTALIDWVWQLQTDPTLFPCGFPGAPGPAAFCPPFEFVIGIVWNGTSFTGIFIDRRPLLMGGNAIVTVVPFNIKGSEITASLSGAMIDSPSSFGWHALTTAWAGGFGTDSFFPVDSAPDNFAFAPWPS